MSLSLQGIKIAGISSAVPRNAVRNATLDIYSEEERNKLIEVTGIVERRTAVQSSVRTSDMCFHAAQTLLGQAHIDSSDISVLVFITQTSDQFFPATSIVLAERLGLPKSTIAFDVNLGCSAYVYGLWIVGQLLAASDKKHALLLVGETASRFPAPFDKSTVALFGDAGTATLLSKDKDAATMHFDLGSDGAGKEHLKLESGFYSFQPEHRHLFMNGPQVFAFTMREVPKSVKAVMAATGWDDGAVDSYVFHQANMFLLKNLVKKAGLSESKMRYSIGRFGNTSSATLPLTVTTEMAAQLRQGEQNTVFAGFGVGWSWGTASVRLGNGVFPDLQEVDW